MKAAALSRHFFRELAKIRDNNELENSGRIMACRDLLLRFLEMATEADRLHFSTIYARIAYLAHRANFPPTLVFQIHRFRHQDPKGLDEKAISDLLLTGYKVIMDCNLLVWEQELPSEWAKVAEGGYPHVYREPDVVGFHRELRVVALEWDAKASILLVREEERPEHTWRIYGDPTNANELVRNALQIMRRVTGFPITLNLLQVEIHEGRKLSPKQIIVDPDFLIDVTAVASCFDGPNKPQPWSSLSRKLLPYEQRPALLKGNIVNLFLDVLINDPQTDFRSLVRMIFQTQPLALCCLSDGEVKELVRDLQGHYTVLRQTVEKGLREIEVERESCQLEPSFYSPTAGIQGRLDLLYHGTNEKGEQTSIVELKSGKIWAPNRHGINRSHFVQTLLYDLMINAAYGRGANVAAYILYSRTLERPLRFAPPEKFTQQEALGARNQLLAVEALLWRIGAGPTDEVVEQTDRLMGKLDAANFKSLSRFLAEDFRRVRTAYQRLNPLERAYFGVFLGFIAREQRLAKTGQQGSESLNGLASLWLDEATEKQQRFELMSGLQLTHYEPENGILTFQRQREALLAKFRTGDIVVLYPTQEALPKKGEVSKRQVFKSTIIELGPDSLRLRLRSRQLNDRSFRDQPNWCIERDVLDSSFSNHYRGLWSWVEASDDERSKWLGLRPPAREETPELPAKNGMTDEQMDILSRMLSAPDYFLLWGPPGTGKTSFMLRQFVAHLLEHSNENILLLAYTNRAVDEICESIESIGPGFRDYIRIGSRYGTSPAYQDRLLSVRSEAFSSRAELMGLLSQTRVFVGTVASVGGKEELFKLKSFQRVVVDEASQILEPLLLGLLCRIPRAVLIGDHRQLPAVVQQGESGARVYQPALKEIGLTQLGTSLFERLFLRAQRQDWAWAYGQLRHQGRMHADIMSFPAKAFYDRQLFILPKSVPQRSRQMAALPAINLPEDSLSNKLARGRLLFFPTETDGQSTDRKTNRHEAQLLARMVRGFIDLYAETDRPVSSGDIGIITPYRAQIAKIRSVFVADQLEPDDYTIDTVERYQGGARRIILLSLCTNDVSQMKTLAQTSEEAVDRKLNVAMTRAREHLVIIGCPDILRTVPHYADLLDFIDSEVSVSAK